LLLGCQRIPAHSQEEKTMKRILLASVMLAASAGLSLAQTTSGTSTTMPSTTDQETDSTTTSGTNPNSAKDCAPGQQTGSAQEAAPGQQDTDAKTAAPGQMKKMTEGC
jgi:hypothetical protein